MFSEINYFQKAFMFFFPGMLIGVFCLFGGFFCGLGFIFTLFLLISLIILKQKGKCKTGLLRRPSDFSSYTFPCELCQKTELFNFLCQKIQYKQHNSKLGENYPLYVH